MKFKSEIGYLMRLNLLLSSVISPEEQSLLVGRYAVRKSQLRTLIIKTIGEKCFQV